MAKKKSKEEPADTRTFKVRSVALPKDVDERLHAHATAEERSMSQVIARAVREYLDRFDASRK